MLKKKYDFTKYNYLLVLVILAISSFGALMINSASNYKDCIEQFIGIGAAFILMVLISLFDYNFVLKFYWLMYIISIVLLLAVKFLGESWGTGAKRWIEIGSIQVQPSEFCKILLIFFLAKFLTNHKEKISSFRFLALVVIIVGIPLFLIVDQPDLSTTLLISFVIVTMIYCAGISYKNILIILVCAIPIVITGIIYIQSPEQKLLEPYQVERIMSFIYPEEYDDLRYQQEYAVKAIGSGQLYGKGYNTDDSNSIKNAGHLSVAESDFIFAVVGEELGFIGGCFLILLLAFLVFECILISIYAKDFQGRLVCIGYASLIAYATFINIGVVTLILPNTGLPLPFVSQGFSSLFALYGGAGVVLNISLQRRKKI